MVTHSNWIILGSVLGITLLGFNMMHAFSSGGLIIFGQDHNFRGVRRLENLDAAAAQMISQEMSAVANELLAAREERMRSSTDTVGYENLPADRRMIAQNKSADHSPANVDTGDDTKPKQKVEEKKNTSGEKDGGGTQKADFEADGWKPSCSVNQTKFHIKCLPQKLNNNDTHENDLAFAQMCGLEAAAFKALNVFERSEAHRRIVDVLYDNLINICLHFIFGAVLVKLLFPHQGQKKMDPQGYTVSSQEEEAQLESPPTQQSMNEGAPASKEEGGGCCRTMKDYFSDLSVGMLGTVQLTIAAATALTAVVNLSVQLWEYWQGVYELQVDQNSYKCKAILLSQFFYYRDTMELLVMTAFSLADAVVLFTCGFLALIFQCCVCVTSIDILGVCIKNCCHYICCELCCSMWRCFLCGCGWFWQCKCCVCSFFCCKCYCCYQWFVSTHCNCLCCVNATCGTFARKFGVMVTVILCVGFVPVVLYFLGASALFVSAVFLLIAIGAALIIFVSWVARNVIALLTKPLKLCNFDQPFSPSYCDFVREYWRLVAENLGLPEDFIEDPFGKTMQWFTSSFTNLFKGDPVRERSKVTGQQNCYLHFVNVGQAATKNWTPFQICCPICFLLTLPLLTGLPMFFVVLENYVFADTKWLACDSKFSTFLPCPQEEVMLKPHKFSTCQCRSCDTSEVLNPSIFKNGSKCGTTATCPQFGGPPAKSTTPPPCYGVYFAKATLDNPTPIRLSGDCDCLTGNFVSSTLLAGLFTEEQAYSKDITKVGDLYLNATFWDFELQLLKENYWDVLQDPYLNFDVMSSSQLITWQMIGYAQTNRFISYAFNRCIFTTVKLVTFKMRRVLTWLKQNFYTLENLLTALSGWLKAKNMDWDLLRNAILLGRAANGVFLGLISAVIYGL